MSIFSPCVTRITVARAPAQWNLRLLVPWIQILQCQGVNRDWVVRLDLNSVASGVKSPLGRDHAVFAIDLDLLRLVAIDNEQ